MENGLSFAGGDGIVPAGFMDSSMAAVKAPALRKTSYQFPVYRWIGWLAVAGFAIGLTVMFFIAGLFGIPPPLSWAFLVIVFSAGVLLLDRPRGLLAFMMFYFMLMPGNRLLGLLGLPLPGFVDELFFLPFIAVIVMNWIQRRKLDGATIFPAAFCLIAALSWYVNGKPSAFTSMQVTLIMLKSYILWYFCRLTCTFENEHQLLRWEWIYILYATMQFFYNVLWQKGPWPKYHPDHSGGVFGPEGFGSAHIVGYLCVFALLLIAGWWVSVGHLASRRKRWAVVLCLIIASYNLIFMTDTKHALLLFPLAALPFLFHPHFPLRLRTSLVLGGAIIMVFAGIYMRMTIGAGEIGRLLMRAQDTPKGDIFYAVTADFPHLVPYPLLGAGPGRFGSSQATAAKAPLARRYIIPEMMALRRAELIHRNTGSGSGGSILGTPTSDFFMLMGEFGWLGAATYYSFLAWVAVKLFHRSSRLPLQYPLTGLLLSLSCCVIFLAFTTVIVPTATIAVVAFPLWMLIGRAWDMDIPKAPAARAGSEPVPSDA